MIARPALAFGLALLLIAPLALAGPPAGARTGSTRVVDGDTLVVAGGRVRLWGIDAPESRQRCERGGVDYACGREATAHLRSVIGGAELACAPRTKDRYGRTVAVCRAGTTDIGAAMVRDGWALAFVRYSADYVVAEREARETRRGMWAGSFTPPWEWRAVRRRRHRRLRTAMHRRQLRVFQHPPHPEEHRAAMRLEGWATQGVLGKGRFSTLDPLPTLRDAALRVAPQGVVGTQVSAYECDARRSCSGL